MGNCEYMHAKSLQSCTILWTVAARLLCPWGFSRPEYWSGLPRPPLNDLPNPAIEPAFLVSPAWAGVFFTTSTM